MRKYRNFFYVLILLDVVTTNSESSEDQQQTSKERDQKIVYQFLNKYKTCDKEKLNVALQMAFGEKNFFGSSSFRYKVLKALFSEQERENSRRRPNTTRDTTQGPSSDKSGGGVQENKSPSDEKQLIDPSSSTATPDAYNSDSYQKWYSEFFSEFRVYYNQFIEGDDNGPLKKNLGPRMV